MSIFASLVEPSTQTNPAPGLDLGGGPPAVPLPHVGEPEPPGRPPVIQGLI